ncbi:MAG: hypothetical protein GY854_27115 [Deltaproteobacteria bacterium]|nr:hypothetical protein [Deltaproteobacteria bacterium]
MKSHSVTALSVGVFSLLLGCSMPPGEVLEIGEDGAEDFQDTEGEDLGGDADADSDSDSDSDADGDADGDEDPPCEFDCRTAYKCGELNGTIHEDMDCPGEKVCCENAVYRMMWSCIICEHDEPEGN